MNKDGKHIWGWLRRLWRRELLVIAAAACLLLAVFAVLSSIPNQAAQPEHTTAQNSQSLEAIVENPVNAPYKIVVFALTSYSPSARLVRATSFIFYIGACLAMFYTLKHWHNKLASALTTAAFATNSVVLSVGRLGTPLVSVMSFFIFSSLLLWQLHSRSNKFVPILVLTSLSALLYVPGAVWFLLILGLVYWNRFRKIFTNVKTPAVIIGVIISLLVISPLVLGFARNSSTLLEWLLLPDTIDWSSVPRSILRVPSAFVYRMPTTPLINVERLPVFDIASGILFLIGLNAYRKKVKLDRTRVMLGSVLIGMVAGALGQLLMAIVILLPFAYSVIAAGIEFLLDEWYSVFPRNPFARSFGVVLVTSAVLFSMYYQVTRFFVVWPQMLETRSTYNKSLIIEDYNGTADTIE